MEIKTIVLKDTNCYLISSENAAVVIDPGYESSVLEKFLNDNADKERMILITHGHFDHIGGAESLRKNSGVKIAIGEFDNPALSDNILNEGAIADIEIAPFDADILLKDGEEFSVGDLEIKVFRLEGHTVGSVCYYVNGVLFTGDVLFYHGFGNTCFHGGSRRKMVESLSFLFNNFPVDTKVYSGHGIVTTIDNEKNFYGR